MAQVEVNEMLCLVGDVAAEVPPDDAVPGGVVLLVKLLKKGQKKKIGEKEKRKKIKNQNRNCNLQILANILYHEQRRGYH